MLFSGKGWSVCQRPVPCLVWPYLLLLCPTQPSHLWSCCPGDLPSSGVGTAKRGKRSLTLQRHPGASPRLGTWQLVQWEEVHGKRVSRGVSGTAAKSRGQMQSQTPGVKQVVSGLVTSLQKIT